ncbi:MAG: threonine/serine exporter family protein [Verrucomicrobiales bacterium]|jgi:uncharacterized membrane protein YjjP (DUF1212 family)|nr:threonine/serine exporter family protein [Verrucomicrobiales bacterium]
MLNIKNGSFATLMTGGGAQDFTEPEQRKLTRLCMQTAQLLMQHGAESALVENVTVRMGEALGLEKIQLGITANALSLTTLTDEHCITTVRRNIDGGINMHVVTEVQRLMLRAERREITLGQVERQLNEIKPLHYNKWLLCVMIGLSCASFARLMGADWTSCAVAGVASALSMLVRLTLSIWHFNPMLNFTITAFVATSLAGLSVPLAIGEQPRMAMAASVLLLIPGYPLINAVSDMLKGYANTGLSRWIVALLLVLAASVGIFMALSLWKIKLWI